MTAFPRLCVSFLDGNPVHILAVAIGISEWAGPVPDGLSLSLSSGVFFFSGQVLATSSTSSGSPHGYVIGIATVNSALMR